MALNSFDRNYGTSLNSREFFFGDVGFVTFAAELTGIEIGTTAVSTVDMDLHQTALSAANYNQFKLAQVLGQRAVVTATSSIGTVTTTAKALDARVIAHAEVGTYVGAGRTAMTFVIERADVLVNEGPKLGAAVPSMYEVKPVDDILAVITAPGFFRLPTGLDATSVANAGLTVFRNLTPIVE